MNKYINPGYNPQLEEMHFTEEDYIFGGASKLPQVVLNPERQWKPPTIEVQNKSFDGFTCTNFALCNAVEMLHFQKYGQEVNFSDRFSAVTSGTIPGQGNSHKNVAEAARKNGFVYEEILPFTELMTKEQYFSPIGQEVANLGLQWVSTHTFGYEKVNIEDLWDTLQLSPVQGAVDSRANTRGRYTSPDHSIVIRGGIYKKEIYTFDSYLGRNLVYSWDYPFKFLQRYHYEVTNEVQGDIKNIKITNFIQWLLSQLNLR